MKRQSDVLEYFTKVPLFSACTKKDLTLLAKHSERIKIPAGETITKEGRIGYEFYVILEGKASVQRNGKEINVLGPGDFFGELSLLDRAPRNATVVALTDVDSVMLGQREFTAALDLVPTLAHKLLIGMARRIHDMDAQKVN